MSAIMITIKVPSEFPLAAFAVMARAEGYRLKWVQPEPDKGQNPRLYEVVPLEFRPQPDTGDTA